MLIRARLFAVHRERAGTDRLDVDLPAGATVADLVEEVVGRVPDLAPVLRGARYAVNREYLPSTTVLQSGDEVAFIPPVAGGESSW